jgi:hypothetical protein
MSRKIRKLEREAAKTRKAFAAWQAEGGKGLERYAEDPCGYARDILKVILTADQEEILRALHSPPRKVLVPSAHDVGKTHTAAVAVNHHFDCCGPCVALTTAPTERDVIDLLWTEVRLQRLKAQLPSHYAGPRSPEMRRGEDWYAKGFTARKGESFSGRHRARMLFVMDEANGIEPIYWQTTRTMFDPSPEMGHKWLAIFNPTSTTTQAYIEDQLADDQPDNPPWTRIRLSALNHPNVRAELEGRPKVVPGAVGVAMIEEWLRDWAEKVDRLDDVVATDVEWPPSSITGVPGKWYRPGAIFQARALGLWPETGSGIWSDALFTACEERTLAISEADYPQIGCDTATGKGDDFHAIHGRWGGVSLHHETANTMDPVRICERIKSVCVILADYANQRIDPARRRVEAKKIQTKIDDDGTGNACVALLRRWGYSVTPVGAGTAATKPSEYPNRRSQLWFDVKDHRARRGLLSLKLLDRETRRRLKQQLLAPEWDVTPLGARVVEPKAVTKDKIGRSPDDADALNLAYLEVTSTIPKAIIPEAIAERRGLGVFAVDTEERRRGRRWT